MDLILETPDNELTLALETAQPEVELVFEYNFGGNGGGSGGGVAISANGSSMSSGTVSFQDAHGVSFGLNNGTLTASHNGLTNSNAFLGSGASSSFLGTGATASFLGTAATGSFVNTSQSSLFRQTSADSQLQFTSANSNFLGTGATASFRHTSADSQLRFTSADSQLRFTSADSQLQFTSANSRFVQEWQLTGNSSGTNSSAQGSRLYFQGGNNITLSGSSNSIVFSAPALSSISGTGIVDVSTNGSTISIGASQSNQQMSVYGVSNTTQASSGTINASNFSVQGAGNVSVGVSNGSLVVSGSQSVQTQNMVSVLGSTGNISFANSNGVTIGGNASTITLSHNGLTSQSNQALSAGNGSFAFQTASFSNANGISFSTSAGSAIVASHNGITSQSIQTQNMVSVLGSTGNISFGNANGITFGGNASTVTASHNGLTSQSNQAVSAANGSSAFQTISFADSNGVSWSTAAAGLIATVRTDYASSNHSHGNPTLALTNLSGTTASASNGFTLSLSAGAGGGATSAGLFATGNTTQSSSGTQAISSLMFQGAGNVSVGVSNGSVVVSGGTAAASPVNFAAGTTSGNLGSVSFADSNGVFFGLNGSTITATVQEHTWSYFNPRDGFPLAAGQQGNASLHIQPAQMPNVTFDQICFPVNYSQATNSTLTVSLSMWLGIYTRNNSTLSLASSTSGSISINGSGTVSSNTYVGQRLMTIPWTGYIDEAQYYVGIISRSSTAGANASLSQLLASQINSNFSGILGAASAATAQQTRGLGVYTASTTAMPASVAFTQLNGTNSLVLRPPAFYFVSQTF